MSRALTKEEWMKKLSETLQTQIPAKIQGLEFKKSYQLKNTWLLEFERSFPPKEPVMFEQADRSFLTELPSYRPIVIKCIIRLPIEGSGGIEMQCGNLSKSYSFSKFIPSYVIQSVYRNFISFYNYVSKIKQQKVNFEYRTYKVFLSRQKMVSLFPEMDAKADTEFQSGRYYYDTLTISAGSTDFSEGKGMKLEVNPQGDHLFRFFLTGVLEEHEMKEIIGLVKNSFAFISLKLDK